MTKRQFCLELADRVGIDLKTATALFEAHEDLVMEVIAMEDTINFSWGKIYGYFRESRKVYGMYSKMDSVKARGGWSLAKGGMPGVEWSYKAKEYIPIDPTELYCEWEEAKYTTKARQYRQDRGLPEIPEYDGMSEEMINSLCKKADEKRYGRKTKKQMRAESKLRLERAQSSATRKYLMRLEWIDQKVSQGLYTREEAEKVPMQIILEEKREQWQDLIKRYEESPLSFELAGDRRQILKLNPYEIYKENSMADYYRKLMEDNDLDDEELLKIMKEDIENLVESEKEPEEKQKSLEEIKKMEERYDEEGYRVDENGERIQYWQTWK